MEDVTEILNEYQTGGPCIGVTYVASLKDDRPKTVRFDPFETPKLSDGRSRLRIAHVSLPKEGLTKGGLQSLLNGNRDCGFEYQVLDLGACTQDRLMLEVDDFLKLAWADDHSLHAPQGAPYFD